MTALGRRLDRLGVRIDNRLGVPYSRLWREGSMRTAMTYARENHWFDIRRRIDTSSWVGREEYPARLAGVDHKIYMPVWTSTVSRSLRDALDHLGPHRRPGTFVDIGCGKGKALIAAREVLTRRGHRDVDMIGVEHLQALTVIAERNYWSRFGELPHIHVGDVAEFDPSALRAPVLFFLYNPFVGSTLEGFARSAAALDALVIYVNPVESDAFIAQGFNEVLRVDAWHPVASYQLLLSRRFKSA